jgi:hypothetical protein
VIKYLADNLAHAIVAQVAILTGAVACAVAATIVFPYSIVAAVVSGVAEEDQDPLNLEIAGKIVEVLTEDL